MNKQQLAAWNILTKEEQMALNLSTVHHKSTWEAGEIMGKAHYKYLEIHARGVKFFRLFAEYFTLFDELFPENLHTNKTFIKYINLLIGQRKPMKMVLAELGDTEWDNLKNRNAQIENSLKLLNRNDKTAQCQHLMHIIKDFDRWNNFRILPLSLQESSAFKRRNKHKIKKLLSLNSHLHPLALQRVIKLYEAKKATHLAKQILFLPIISVFDKGMSQVIGVTQAHQQELSQIPMFLFLYKEDAEKYLEITSAYLFKENHSCRDGQIFWPELRYTIKKAINYDMVMGVNPHRKAFLDNAGIDPEIRKFLKKRRVEQDSLSPRTLGKRMDKYKFKYQYPGNCKSDSEKKKYRSLMRRQNREKALKKNM